MRQRKIKQAEKATASKREELEAGMHRVLAKIHHASTPVSAGDVEADTSDERPLLPSQPVGEDF